MKKQIILTLLVVFYTHVFSATNSLEFGDTLRKRAIDNRFYNLINDIHKLHYFISHFILNNARMPSRLDLTGAYLEIDNNIWPKSYNAVSNSLASEVTFDIDMNNYKVTYRNIVTSTLNAEIVNLFTYNTAHTQNTVLDNSSSLDISIPFDIKTTNFIIKINLTPTNVHNVIGKRTDPSVSCTAGGNLQMLYSANGFGGFNRFYCNVNTFESVTAFDNNTYLSDINTSYPRPNGGVVYGEFNTTHATMNTYDNNISFRIVK